MEGHRFSTANSKRYEQHLSSFGKKVFHELIKQWDKARIQNQNDYQHRQFPSHHKKVLYFNDDSVVDSPYTPSMPPNPSDVIFLEDKSFNFNLAHEPEPKIPKSVELIKTVPNHNNNTVDFIPPSVITNRNLLHDIYNKESDDDITFDEENIGGFETTSKSKDINWDNMLDSELFIETATNEEVIRGNNKTFSHNVLNNSIAINNENNINKSKKRNIKKTTDTITKKVRTDDSIMDNPAKQTESVKQTNKKNSFRKQKYTKTVKNWLDNVEIVRPVEENKENVEHISDGEINSVTEKNRPITDNVLVNVNSNNNTTNNKEKVVVDKALNTTKKVVQAQLANKDGVMKYSKPKNNGEEAQNTTELHTKPKDIKEKKIKKFVAPIKSQIPVKDVTFEVTTVDESNISFYETKLHENINDELHAVLMYSNGFCQLNSHHTDGTCAPDGLIISNNNMYYYFKGLGQKLTKTLKHLLDNNKIICYGGRSVLIYVASYLEMEINSIDVYDAKIGGSLLDPDNPPENFTDLQKLLSYTASYTIATECTLQRSAWYLTLLKECWTKLYEMLMKDSLWKVFVEIEMKLLPIIADMERRGISIDLDKLKSMEEVLLTRMKLVEQECYKAAGKVFQINSPMQVRAILYDELQLDSKCNVKIRETICKGAKSTSETMLRSLVSEHPLPKLILEYRHLHKAHATFLTGIAQQVKDGVVRPTWVQTAAATGRIASNNPNLQAIPKAPFSIVMFPESGDHGEHEQLMFRSVYVSRAGRSLLAADFKHVECRVFAHAAADADLLHALSASEDLFKVLAAKWLKKAECDVVSEERERTKRLVYASLYGAGTRKLMEILDVSYQQALQVAASFNRTFPSLKSFGRGVVSRCRQAGGRLSSLCGRVRRFTNIDSDDFAVKSHAERQAVNFIVQGSAADLCKLAMILTEEQLRSSSPPVAAHLVLQIHDELVWEVDDLDVDRAAGIIRRVMEGCGRGCGVAALPVLVSVGKSWGDMHTHNTH